MICKDEIGKVKKKEKKKFKNEKVRRNCVVGQFQVCEVVVVNLLWFLWAELFG
jgi:hypothetical protein